jgi:hypothetical protein
MKDFGLNQAFCALRKTLNQSQSKFAKMLGCSRHAVISVENRRNGVSDAMQGLILESTGAVLKRNGKVVTYDAEIFGQDCAFTKADFSLWAARFSPDGAKRKYRDCCDWLQVLFEAALRPGFAGLKNRLPALVESLAQWMDRAREEFDLQGEIRDLLMERAKKLAYFESRIRRDGLALDLFTTWSCRSTLNCGPNPEWEQLSRNEPLRLLVERQWFRTLSKHLHQRSHKRRRIPAQPSASGARRRGDRKLSR